MAAATSGTGYRLDGVQEVVKKLNKLDAQTRKQVMKSLLRKTANRLKPPLIANAPTTLHNTFKKRRNISVVVDKKIVGAVWVGYNSDAYKARWLEKGTKIRTTKRGHNRGKIKPRPWIDRTHKQEAPKMVKYLSDNITDIMVTILRGKSRTITKKLNKI